MASTADRLRRAGGRVTRQRLLVADALNAVRHRVSAQELYERVRARHPGIGRATVFRTLEALVAAGAARRLEQDGHVYGYVGCRPEHHHHLACDRCGRVEEIGERFVTAVAERVDAELGFQIDDARMDFYGLCADCRAPAAGPAAEAQPAEAATFSTGNPPDRSVRPSA